MGQLRRHSVTWRPNKWVLYSAKAMIQNEESGFTVVVHVISSLFTQINIKLVF